MHFVTMGRFQSYGCPTVSPRYFVYLNRTDVKSCAAHVRSEERQLLAINVDRARPIIRITDCPFKSAQLTIELPGS